jgi:4a-hydroxytetrahydrobiopterin dehydratase
MPDPLATDQLAAALASLPGWAGGLDGLTRTFRFKDFASAIAFMHAAAPAIDQGDHHPEWTNVYNRVSVRLRTHDAGDRVTSRDVALARLLDGYALQHAGT